MSVPAQLDWYEMFWRVNSLNKTSSIEALLDKENFTLEELLEEEDVVQVARWVKLLMPAVCSSGFAF